MGTSDFEKQRKRNASGESTTSSDSLSQYIPTPPDGGWGWVIVLASFINHVIVDGVAFTFGIFYMEFMRYFGSSKSQTALVGSLLAGFYLMAGPVASAMVNKFGCRVVCITGSLLSASAFVLCTFCTSIKGMMFTYGCMGGFGFGLIYLPSIVSVSYYFEKRRALATGIAVCGAGVGCFIFAPAGRLLMQHFDWKNSMYIVAGVTLNSCICGMLMRPLAVPDKRPRSKNLLDRLKERLRSSKSRKSSAGTAEGGPPSADMLEKLQEVKLAREKALREAEEGEGLLATPDSRRSSRGRLDGKARASSVGACMITSGQIPQIIVEDVAVEESGADDEKTHMMNGGVNVKPEVQSKPEPEVSETKPVVPSGRRKSNTEQALLLSNTDDELLLQASTNGTLTANGLSVKPEDTKIKSLSAANIWGLYPRRRSVPPGVAKEDYARPLYRRDIFYSGSILHISEFRSQPNVRQYVASITTIPSEPAPEKEGRFWKCIPLPKVAKDVLRQMLDPSLLKDRIFMVACLGEIFGFIGLFVPFVFVAERATQLNIPETQAAFLLSVIGITNTIGRVLAGWLADFKWVNSLLLHNVMMILGGVACLLNQFATTYPAMCVYSAFFGLCVATYISLTSIILCDLMGLERLTSAFGMLTLVRGVSSIAGPPIAGLVFDLTNNYDMSFHVGGAMFIIAGLMYCLLHLPVFATNARIRRNSMHPGGGPAADEVPEPEVNGDVKTVLPVDDDEPDLPVPPKSASVASIA